MSATLRCPSCGNARLTPRADASFSCPDCVCHFAVLTDTTVEYRSSGATTAPEVPVQSPGSLPPGYDMLGELGRGGMGVVYRALHRRLDRTCAVKMILAGGHAGARERQRFEAEAQAIARLAHPNIVQIFEVGEHQGQAFMALELCPGGSLDRRLREHPPTPRAAAVIVRDLAQALQAVHAAHLLHRDLKPANVLIAADGTLKVTDFGLAKVLEGEPGREAGAGLTQTGAVMGTPSYMPPEQARGAAHLGPACDIYALGAILYACLTGRPPFRAASVVETLRQVLDTEAVPVRSLNPAVPRDLETICHKCLRKEPAQRYASAQALADDLGRFLEGWPIAARPAGPVERGYRWVRRNPVVAALAAAVVLVLLAGTTVAWTFALEAQREAGIALEKERTAETNEKKANTEANRANLARHAIQIDLALRSWEARDLRRTEEVLGQIAPDFRQRWETRHVASLCRRLVRSFRYAERNLASVGFNRDGKTLLTSGWYDSGGHPQGELRLVDVGTGADRLLVKRPGQVVLDACLSPDETTVLGCECRLLDPASAVGRLWDARTGAEVRTFAGHGNRVTCACFSPDGASIVTGSWDTTLKLWNADTAAVRRTFQGHSNHVTCVAISPDGKTLVSGSTDQTVRRWNVATGHGKQLGSHERPVTSVAINRAGTLIASVSEDGTLKVWDLATGEPRFSLENTHATLSCVRFSPDDKLLLTGDWNGVVSVWDVASRRALGSYRGHSFAVTATAFSPDGRILASAGADGAILLWDTKATQAAAYLAAHRDGVSRVRFSPDGALLLSASMDQTLKIWDARTRLEVRTLTGHTRAVLAACFGLEGRTVLSGGMDRTLKLWDVRTGEVLRSINAHSINVSALAISPEGDLLVSAGIQDPIRIWDARSGQLLRELAGHRDQVTELCFSPDGKTLLSASTDRTLKLWNPRTGALLRILEGHANMVNCAAFSPDGNTIASGSGDKTLKLWDARSGKELRTCTGHTQQILSVAFSPDGGTIVSGSWDRTLKLWDATTGQELLALKGPGRPVQCVSFSPDGRTIASCGDAESNGKPGELMFWEAP